MARKPSHFGSYSQSPSLGSASTDLASMGSIGVGRAALVAATAAADDDFAFAADWARKRGVPLTCNEFGVYRTYSDPQDRAAWLTAVRQAFEKNKVGWTMWDYRGGFGVVTVTNGQVVEDTAVLKALGLAR